MKWLGLLPFLWLMGLSSPSSAKEIHHRYDRGHRFVARANGIMTRMEAIKTMHGFQGFVYAIDSCPSKDQAAKDFKTMKSIGAGNVITFGLCNKGTDVSYYGELLSAAADAQIHIIPLIWTLLDSGQNFKDKVVPIMNAVIEAVKKDPTHVLAVSLGDEPLFDNDAGSPDTLAKFILSMKSEFKEAGLDIPISISDMAYGWKSSGNISAMADAVDFFMINNFPYFAQNARYGGDNNAWEYFTRDIEYFEGIAKGKPLLVTQTGWPSNKELWAPNSKNIVVNVNSEQAYWELLNEKCSDYFKAKNIGWLWRSFNDQLSGWGAYDIDGKPKWDINVNATC